jgi:hypothetical protein
MAFEAAQNEAKLADHRPPTDHETVIFEVAEGWQPRNTPVAHPGRPIS